MDKLCHGISFTNPTQATHYKSTVSMYIDDASNVTNSFLRWLHEPPPDDVVLSMLQHDAQTWERLLWTTGGLLNLLKCLFYIMAWQFDDEGHPTLKSKRDILSSLQLTSGANPDPQLVKQYDVSQAHRYLGDWLPAICR
jgi:hypothetical protein